jgi:hypothetical protein
MINVNRYISIFLLACFLPVMTPREIIHDLFGHEDTHDVYHSTVTIEKLHRHCSIYQMTFSSFISFLKSFSPEKEVNNSFYFFPHEEFIPAISVNLSSLRAPPLYQL